MAIYQWLNGKSNGHAVCHTLFVVYVTEDFKSVKREQRNVCIYNAGIHACVSILVEKKSQND